MPQKYVFTRTPLMNPAHLPLGRGMVRSSDALLKKLYTALCREIPKTDDGSEQAPDETDFPAEALEPAFCLSCLLKENPMEEKPAILIRKLTADPGDGAFPGSLAQQICIARAEFAMFEYQPDRSLLKRLADWCRWMELHWDSIRKDYVIRVQSADLMEFLVKFYRASGLKAVLRLCARLRSDAIDWTSYLHNERRRGTVEIRGRETEIASFYRDPLPEETDFFITQYYMNHAELTADGIRYSAWSGQYSGNIKELSAGKAGWNQIKKTHGVICGGTSGNAFFQGNSAPAGISSLTIAAWTEAFLAQMYLSREPWILNELTVLIHNALPEAIRHIGKGSCQRINRCGLEKNEEDGFDPFGDDERERFRSICRLARAYAGVYQHAVTLAEKELISVNMLLNGKYCIPGGDHLNVLQARKDGIRLFSKQPMQQKICLFLAESENREIGDSNGKRGIYLVSEKEWKKGEGFVFQANGNPIVCQGHHQGIFIFLENRLMCLDAENGYQYAAAGAPYTEEGHLYLPVRKAETWKMKNGIMGDIPVLPKAKGKTVPMELHPYDEMTCRIALIPKDADYD